MLNIGAEAPSFEADSTQGKIRLSDWIGQRPVVLIFYPKDETPGCTAQLCAVRDSKAKYDALGAVVIGVNPGGLDDHRAFARHHGLDFPIVSDKDETIRKRYDVGKILGLFLQQRVVYVIGKDGRIAYAYKGNPPTEVLLEVLLKS
ncbi:peroxiredoxin [Paenibacillus flagellatus]|uniref:thioredoxin-dependent peroxiredoxin n=1 Tax=Paenibacillus flagellatus TaxID=2211139 RepID=A0A2V5KAE7_9BACL|nr:peroxiredoxin [Paenibacillus flagellatus]PYI56418.1 peroxiredoxin [Paenibacillus flagellatus]